MYELGICIYFILRSEIMSTNHIHGPRRIQLLRRKVFSSSTSSGCIRADAGGFVALIRNDEMSAHVMSRMPDP